MSDEAPTAQVILRLKINVDGPFGQLQRAIMRMVDLVSFGLTIASRAELSELPQLPEVFVQLTLGSRLPLEKLPPEFKTWMLGSSLRDMIEALEPFFEELWTICLVLKIDQGERESFEELLEAQQGLQRDQAEFRELSVTKKLDLLLEATSPH